MNLFDDARVVGQVGTQAPWLGTDAVLVRSTPSQGPLAPLLDARRRLHEIAEIPPWDPYRLRAGISRRLLGDADQTSVNDVVADLNHAVALRPEARLVIEAAEHLDADTVAVLRRAHEEPDWLHLPVLVLFEAAPASGPAVALAVALGIPRAEAPPVSLPPNAQLVLRAAAHIGAEFAVDAVAAKLQWSPLAVLLALQQAADAGERLVDNGEGSFSLPPSRVAALREGVLPSLAARWSGPTEEAPPPEEAPRVAQREEAQALAAAAREALDHGDPARAQRLAETALEVLGPHASTPEGRPLYVSFLLELAHAHWRASGEGATLTGALAIAEQARQALAPDDPADMVASVLALGAWIRYDLGDPAGLSDALDQLVEASQRLQAAGQPVAAASLLNDQAAVWTRLGDPVRATHLLRKSREVFSASADRDPTNRLATVELAETEHLLARLPFHVASRPGQEVSAWTTALTHAESSEQLYRDLPDPLSAARTLETQGRILTRLGDHEAAMERLRTAADEQQALRDALGLARTAGGLAEVLAALGQPEQALRLLGDSIRLNVEVGTPIGLAHNRQSLGELSQQISSHPETPRLLADIQQRLEHAEQLVGTVEL